MASATGIRNLHMMASRPSHSSETGLTVHRRACARPTADKLAPMSLLCYTDGGCRGNPGPGGWAFLLIDPRTTKALERAGGERQTTNNRMEMTGAIRALESLRKDNTPIAIHTDSKYLVDCCTNWMPGWKRRGWKRKDGPLKNVDLLKRLDELMARHPITWHWVKGHAGVRGNEHVDALLNAAMDRLAAGGDPAGERSFRWKGALP